VPRKGKITTGQIKDPAISRVVSDLSDQIDDLYKRLEGKNTYIGAMKAVIHPNKKPYLALFTPQGWQMDINGSFQPIEGASNTPIGGDLSRIDRHKPIEGESLKYNANKVLPIKDSSGSTELILKNTAGALNVRNATDTADADISLKDLTVGTFTGNQTAIFNAGLSTKNGATGPGYIEFFEDSDHGTNKCTLMGPGSTLDYTVTLPPGAGTIRTVETTPLVISYPFYFNDTTTGRTYFRDSDDPDDIMSWDGFDTDDDTTVGNTISINLANAVSGVVVPYACTYVGAYFLGYQTQNVAGQARFQTWTGTPGDDTSSAITTVTLRTTNDITAQRTSESVATSDVSIALNAGDVVYPAFQYVSGASTVWYGTISLKFENITV